MDRPRSERMADHSVLEMEDTDAHLDSRLCGNDVAVQAQGPAPVLVLGGELHADTVSAGFSLLYPPYIPNYLSLRERGLP